MRAGKITSGAEYRMDEQFQNLLIFGIFWSFEILEFFQVLKFWKFFKSWNSGNLSIVQFWKFQKLPFYKISNMRAGKITSVAEYRMDEQFQNLLIFGIFSSFEILETCQFYNLENSKNFLFTKFRKFIIWKISQFPKLL